MRGHSEARRRLRRGAVAIWTAVALAATMIAPVSAPAAAISPAALSSAAPLMACGWWHTIGLRTDGTLLATGLRGNNRCEVSGWSNVVQVVAGEDHTVGLKADGTVVATGVDTFGQCSKVSGWTDIVQVAGGKDHTVGRRADGSVVATGSNADGQCNVSGWTGIVAVAAGNRHTVGLKSDGTCVATGYNFSGQCAVGGWTNVAKIACGAYHSIGLKSDGTVVAVGSHLDGECNVSGWANIVAIAGGDYTTFGVKSDGTVNALGYNEYGQCNVSGWTGIVGVSAGCYHSVGWRADGTCVGAGSNAVGQVGVSGWRLVDWTPPTVTADVAGTLGDNGWYTDDASVSLDASDGVLGLGVECIEYSRDGGGWTAYADALAITDEGTTTIAYRASDSVENTSVPETVTVEVDKTPPTTTCGAAASYAGTATVALSSEDTVSGVAAGAVEYALDSVQPTSTYTVPIVVTTPGEHVLTYWAKDNAGNTERAKTTRFTVTAVTPPPSTEPTPSTIPTPPAGTFVAVQGSNRIGTAIAASKAAFTKASTVVIATAWNFPDALGGSSLAGALEAPLLLTDKDALPGAVSDEIERLGATDAVILGGTPAVAAGVETQLATLLGGTSHVKRIGGADRYATAALVGAEAVKVMQGKGRLYDGTVLVAVGDNFPDALAASPLAAGKGWPILLTRTTALPDASANALTSLAARKALVLGSDKAVGGAVETALKTKLGAGNVTRLAGANRYLTAIEIASYGKANGMGYGKLAIATGENYPDALSGGVMAGRFNSMMLLTPKSSLQADVGALIKAEKAGIEKVYYLGSTSAVAQNVRDAVAALLK